MIKTKTKTAYARNTFGTKRTISARQREQAVVLCGTIVTHWAGWIYDRYPRHPLTQYDNRVGSTARLVRLARTATDHTHRDEPSSILRQAYQWAEAEALLRDGWCPS